ncbi:DUF480 domain-containing protein [Nitriliruptoraceae bacterium ZYF776]|nr:DUF480 domain-containing protein [Profundirhabdus halotolerans]
MQLTAQGRRVLGCLVEKELATPDQYPLSANALRAACNQSTGRDPVVDYDDEDVRAGLDDLKAHQLVRTEYARSSRVPKTAHRLDEQLDLDPAQRTVLALLLLRGPQTTGELRTRAGRMHTFASVELVEAVLGSLAAHRFGTLVEQREKEPGRRERRWAHLLGGDGAAADHLADDPAATSEPTGTGRYRPFHDAVVAGDWDAAVAQLADDVVFRSPAVHAPYEGAPTVAHVLRAVATVFEGFRYVDVLDQGDRAVLVFEAHVGDRQLQGIDLLRFDEDGRIAEFTVMIRPLSGLTAVVEGMRAALGR